MQKKVFGWQNIEITIDAHLYRKHSLTQYLSSATPASSLTS